MRSKPFKIRLNWDRQSPCARSIPCPDSIALDIVYDQTQVRRESFIIELKGAQIHLQSDSSLLNILFALEASLVQTQLRPKLFMIRLKCNWNRLWSKSSALKSTCDHTQLRSTVSLRSKHSWSRLSCTRGRLWSDSVILEVIFDRTQVRSKTFMVKFKFSWQSLCARGALESSSDSNALNNLSALEVFLVKTGLCSKPFLINFSCARSKLWSDSRALDSDYDNIQARSTVSLRSKRAQLRLRSDSSVLKSVSVQTQRSSNPPMIRFKCARQS